MVSRVFQVRFQAEMQFRRHRRTNGLDLIPTLMLRQATAIHFAPTKRLDLYICPSLSVLRRIAVTPRPTACTGTRYVLLIFLHQNRTYRELNIGFTLRLSSKV